MRERSITTLVGFNLNMFPYQNNWVYQSYIHTKTTHAWFGICYSNIIVNGVGRGCNPPLCNSSNSFRNRTIIFTNTLESI